MNLFQRILTLFPGISRKSAAGDAWIAGLQQPGMEGGLSDPYGLSPWVQRAVKHITGPVASVPIKFSMDGGKTDLEDPVLSAFWNRPAKAAARGQRLSKWDTMEATVGWLSLKGEFFWLLDDTWQGRNRTPSPLVIARPDRMTPITDSGELLGWIWTDGSGRRHELIPENVVTSSFWNPEDDIRGAAPMRTAELAAQSDYASARFWKSLAESNGDLGETVIAPNGVSPEQVEQIKLNLRRKRAAAKRGKYEPMFLVGDLKTEAPQIRTPDAQSVAQRMENRHEVFIALGVPPSFADVVASYSVGSASDRYKLIEETCMPLAAKIAEAVEVVSARLTGRTVSVRFDFSDHSTMQQVRSERMKAGTEMHARGVPWKTINDHLSLGLQPFPGWDKAWLPLNLVEVDAPEPAAVPMPPAAPAAAAVKALDELEVLMRGCPCEGCRDGAAQPPQDRRKAAATARQKRLESVLRFRAPWVRRIRVTVDRAIYDARKQTLANIAEAEKAERAIRAGAFDFLFDLGEFLDGLVGPVMRIIEAGHEAAGAALLKDELGSEEPFTADPNAITALRARENFIKDAGQEIWAEVRDTLDEGIQAGDSYPQLAARVRDKFNGISKERSMRIAVTETGIAQETGRHSAMVQAGVEWKEWMTAMDDRVRLTHMGLDGKIVPFDEPFIVGGAAMMFPCDPAGPAAEIINCRCVHGPAQGPDPDDIEGNDPTLPIPF
jgi:SPP1 gp7 family putative phage head morphogenesis protein